MWTGNNVTRPFRVAGAAALAPVIDRGLKGIQKKLNLPSQMYAFLLVVGSVAGVCFTVVGFLVLSKWGKWRPKSQSYYGRPYLFDPGSEMVKWINASFLHIFALTMLCLNTGSNFLSLVVLQILCSLVFSKDASFPHISDSWLFDNLYKFYWASKNTLRLGNNKLALLFFLVVKL